MSAPQPLPVSATETDSPESTDSNVSVASGPPALLSKGLWPLSKLQAFGLHAVLSILVFSSLVAVMLIWWFPGELFMIDGGWEGLKLVAMVDLVLGPALTLLLYKPGKPKLALDMSMIAMLQIAALGYGFYTTHQQRTVAIVHAESTFNTLSAAALSEADERLLQLEESPRALSQFESGHPRMLLTPPPGKGQFGKFMAQMFNDYPPPYERSDQFVALDTNLEAFKKSAKSLEDLEATGQRVAVEAALASAGLNADDFEFHKFKARYANGIAIFDPKSMTIVDYVAAAASVETEVAEGSE